MSQRSSANVWIGFRRLIEEIPSGSAAKSDRRRHVAYRVPIAEEGEPRETPILGSDESGTAGGTLAAQIVTGRRTEAALRNSNRVRPRCLKVKGNRKM